MSKRRRRTERRTSQAIAAIKVIGERLDELRGQAGRRRTRRKRLAS